VQGEIFGDRYKKFFNDFRLEKFFDAKSSKRRENFIVVGLKSNNFNRYLMKLKKFQTMKEFFYFTS
jgi:hypothetical protein